MPLSPGEAVDWGSFERDNADCFTRSWSNGAMRNVQLVWAILCGMQGAYTITQYPRISWEECFLPLAEVLVYGLQAGNVGYIQQFDGKVIPWARYMGWIVMFPVVLGQVNRVHSYRILGWNANTVLIAFGVLAIVFQISADNCGSDQGQQWMFLFFAFLSYAFVFRIVWKVLSRRWEEFDLDECPEASKVALKLRLLAATFFIFWAVYPILKVLSPQTLCIADENMVSAFYLIADIFTFNVFVGLYWNTLWQELDGDWSVESLKSRIASGLQDGAGHLAEEADGAAPDRAADEGIHNAPPPGTVGESEAVGQALPSMKASQMRQALNSNLDSQAAITGGAVASPGTPGVSRSMLNQNPDSAESPDLRASSRTARRDLLAMMESSLQRQQMYLSHGNVSADVGYRPSQGNFTTAASELVM